MTATPDERSVGAHLRSGRFLAGVAAEKWRLDSTSWPHTIIAVGAAERGDAPREVAIRFELTGYPHAAPTGGIWDITTNTSLALERRPKGERLSTLFRVDGWVGGATAMYAPWDRMGLQAHPDWAQKYTMEAWSPTRDLSFILTQIHERLNADDYLGL